MMQQKGRKAQISEKVTNALYFRHLALLHLSIKERWVSFSRIWELPNLQFDLVRYIFIFLFAVSGTPILENSPQDMFVTLRFRFGTEKKYFLEAGTSDLQYRKYLNYKMRKTLQPTKNELSHFHFWKWKFFFKSKISLVFCVEYGGSKIFY